MSVLQIKDGNGNWIPIHTIEGEDGHTPEKGVDYWTASDIASIEADVSVHYVTVSGTDVSITGVDNTVYICGEVSTISITPPAQGIIDVIFTSGTSAAVLTVTPPVGVTMKWNNGFDPSSLSTSTTYELNILNGEYGGVSKWS